MIELISVISLFLGVPLLIIGGVWSVVRARTVDMRWMLGMIFLFPVTLPAFSLLYWKKARNPLIITIIGLFMLLIPVYFSLEQ